MYVMRLFNEFATERDEQLSHPGQVVPDETNGRRGGEMRQKCKSLNRDTSGGTKNRRTEEYP